MAIALVQSKSATGTSGTSITVTLNSNTTAGNCLVVCVGTDESTDNPTVSGVTLGGSAGNFAAANTAYSNTDLNSAIWVDPNCAGGQTSVVISLTGGAGGGTEVAAYVLEFSGVQTSSAVDKAPTGQNSSGTTWTSGSTGTLSQANEVAVACLYDTTTPATPGSPWTELTATAGTDHLAVGYQVVSATTALTYNGTSSTSGFYGCCIITLKALTNVSVALTTATVSVAAPAPGIATGPIALPVSALSVAAYPVTPSTFTAVTLTTATVTAGAHSPGIVAGPVQLTTATVATAAQPPGVPRVIALVTASVTVAAHSPAVPRAVSLHVATVTVTAPAPTVVITTPKLVASITATSGTDPYGNPYQAGITVYGTSGSFAQLTDGNLQFQGTSSQASPAYVLTDGGAGILEMSSGTATEDDSPAIIDLLSAEANDGTSAIDLTTADQVQIGTLVLNGQTIAVPQSQPASPEAAPSSYTQTWGQNITGVLNQIIATLASAGLW